MPGQVEIRRLVADDLRAYKQLRDTMLAAHPSAFSSDAVESAGRSPDSYRARLGLELPHGGVFTLGAWEGASLVGAISCERDARTKVHHVGHVVGMMVLGPWQGRGVGRALLAHCLALARRADGLEMLTLTVTAGNLAAIRIYEQAGFVRCGMLPRAIRVAGAYHDKDQMACVL
jgi:GNAT superfamily N-acetyltransferase